MLGYEDCDIDMSRCGFFYNAFIKRLSMHHKEADLLSCEMEVYMQTRNLLSVTSKHPDSQR